MSEPITTTTTTTTPMSEIDKLRYRFGGYRYQMQGSSSGPSWIVPKTDSSYSHPKN